MKTILLDFDGVIHSYTSGWKGAGVIPDPPVPGAIDFLRICRGTLADASTTIEELYAWQFDGPSLRDFTGRKPADGKRDAGAIELMRPGR